MNHPFTVGAGALQRLLQTAFAVVLWPTGKFGFDPHPKNDESGTDHLFIVLVRAQPPIVARLYAPRAVK
jgi:hypothetical protein